MMKRLRFANSLLAKRHEINISSKSLWTVNEMYAEQYSKGRVFCIGDAVHRHPPSNGLGSNSSIKMLITYVGN